MICVFNEQSNPKMEIESMKSEMEIEWSLIEGQPGKNMAGMQAVQILSLDEVVRLSRAFWCLDAV